MSEQRTPFQPIDEGGHVGLSVHSCAGILHIQPAGEVGARCLVFILHALLKIANNAGTFVRTLEVLGECLLHVQPIADGFLRQVINPLTGRTRQHQWEVLDGNIGVTPGNLYRVAVILQPCSWLSGAVIGLDGLVNPETFGVSCRPYRRSKETWSQVWSFPG